MGRLKKYITPEAKQQSRREASKRYYWNNKDQEDAKSRERYKRKKDNIYLRSN